MFLEGLKHPVPLTVGRLVSNHMWLDKPVRQAREPSEEFVSLEHSCHAQELLLTEALS